MQPGTKVKALKNHNRIPEGKSGYVVIPPKGNGTFSKADQWVWVQFEEVFGPKLMKITEIQELLSDLFYGG